MRHRWLAIVVAALPALRIAQFVRSPDARTGPGPYARIAFLRPHDGQTVDFEAGYIRHLDWHRQADDTWAWYGWTIWAGERQRWFVYATFGHSAADLDRPVAAAEDERDNVSNVAPHAEYMGNELYEYLPGPSRGTGEPRPSTRLEFTTVDLVPGAEKEFEAALTANRAALQGETLWYRMVAGGRLPRYVRLSPRPSLSAILDGGERPLPDGVGRLVAKTTVEILNLRPAMCYGLAQARRSWKPCAGDALDSVSVRRREHSEKESPCSR